MINPRYVEWDNFLFGLSKKKHLIHMGINLDIANKFYYFYKENNNGRRYEFRGRSRFITRPKPLARVITNYGQEFTYKIRHKDMFKGVEDMYKFLEKLDAKEIHVDEDISSDKNCLVQVAKNLGITSYVHIHGCLGQKHGFLPLTADYICVWDYRQAMKLMEWGCEPERIIVEGFGVRYDKYWSWQDGIRENVRRSFNVENGCKLFLIAPYTFSNFGDGFDETLKNSLSLIQRIISCKLRNEEVIIKLHPGSPDLKRWQDWKRLERLENNIRIIRDYESMYLVIASDLMLVHHSTMAIDGWQMGKKVCVIDDAMPSGVEEFRDEFIQIKEFDDFLKPCHK